MKNVNKFLAILLLMTGCGGKQQTGDAFITVDVTKNYPKKELILQDFMDVEYIALETGGEFYCQGVVMAVGKEIILVKNFVNDGDIFVFDRHGKGLRKINRIGKGGEEYAAIIRIILDEDNDEMFVNDYVQNKIVVYDLYGKFKRSFRYTEGARYTEVQNYDRDHLICYDSSLDVKDGQEKGSQTFFAIISKQDGSITRKIDIPFEKIKSQRLILRDVANNRTYSSHYNNDYPIIPYHGDWILVELSSDTLYKYLPDDHLTPFMARTPSIQSMNPEVFLFPGILTDRYYFMEIVKKEYDFEANSGFPCTNLVYDRQEKRIFEYNLYNDDYSNKKAVITMARYVNDEIATLQRINADDLVDDYKKGKLKGKLKEIAAGLDEESNPVIVLVKHKKQIIND